MNVHQTSCVIFLSHMLRRQCLWTFYMRRSLFQKWMCTKRDLIFPSCMLMQQCLGYFAWLLWCSCHLKWHKAPDFVATAAAFLSCCVCHSYNRAVAAVMFLIVNWGICDSQLQVTINEMFLYPYRKFPHCFEASARRCDWTTRGSWWWYAAVVIL